MEVFLHRGLTRSSTSVQGLSSRHTYTPHKNDQDTHRHENHVFLKKDSRGRCEEAFELPVLSPVKAHPFIKRNSVAGYVEFESTFSIDTSRPHLPRRLSYAEKQVENKIAKARQEKEKYFEKLENSRRNSTPLPLVIRESSSRAFCPDIVNLCPALFKPASPTMQSTSKDPKNEEVRQRREKLQDLDQRNIFEKYSLHHSNRQPPSSLMKSFECSKRLRLLLQVLFVTDFVHLLLTKNSTAFTKVVKTFQQQQHQKLLRSKENKLLQKWKRRMLLFFVKWRLKRRMLAIFLLESFLKKVYYGSLHFRMVCAKFKTAVKIIQRNVKAMQLCKQARLFVMKKKIEKVFKNLRAEAKEYKNKHKVRSLCQGDSLVHPVFNLDLNLSLEGEIEIKVLVSYIEMKTRERIQQVDSQRKKAQELLQSTHIPEKCLAGTTALARNSSIKQQYPLTSFCIYRETSYKTVIDLIQSIYNEKYPGKAQHDKIIREQLKQRYRYSAFPTPSVQKN